MAKNIQRKYDMLFPSLKLKNVSPLQHEDKLLQTKF
jgi:hypothetical protein